MRFLKSSTLLLLVLTATGCCSIVAKSGDVKILRCRELMHTRGSKFFRMELPAVSLGQVGTQVIHVRDLPPFLKGLFHYDLSLPLPDGEGTESERTAPWLNVKMYIAFRRLDGTEIFRKPFILGMTPHGFTEGHYGWWVGWTLGSGLYDMDPVPVMDESFDIVVSVEQPSEKKSDKIYISAWATYLPKP
jgi:hypothetical protein